MFSLARRKPGQDLGELRQGAVQAGHAETPREAPPSLKPIPMELGDSLRDIGDPELRTVLESLARSLG